MSLLITSSRQQEFDNVVQGTIGIEQPFSYINHMNSPLIIEADSEVAVVSIKCERDAKLVIDSRGYTIGIYWGKELDDSQDLFEASSKNSTIYATVPAGEYTATELAQALEIAINDVCVSTYSNMNSVTVTTEQTTDGDFTGFSFTFAQNASSTDKAASLSAIAAVNDNNSFPVGDLQTTYGDDEYQKTDAGVFTFANRTYTAGTGLNTAVFNHPLSSTSGVCEVDFSGATGNLKIGLVRNLPEDRPCPENFNIGTGNANKVNNNYDEFYDFNFNIERTDAETTTLFYFTQAYVNEVEGIGMGSIPSASQVANTIANGSFGSGNASFGKVRITRFGQELKVELRHNSGAGGDTTIFDSSVASVKAIGLPCDLLYLKVELESDGGALVIDQFDSDQTTNRTSTAERNYGFGTGSGAEEEMELLNYDTEARYAGAGGGIIVNVEDGDTTFSEAQTYEKLNASGGQDRKWVMLLAPNSKYQTGLQIPDDFSQELGFGNQVIRESVNKAGTSVTNDIVFNSDKVPSLIQLKNMFVRFNGLQQTSYNANKGSISKIIYACPRFDSSGTRTGELYYEPHERVYVDCNNSEAIRLSDVGIDLVDVNEQFCTDLLGTTQINFHIRKKK